MDTKALERQILTSILLLCGGSTLIFSRYTVDNFNTPKIPLILTAGLISICGVTLVTSINKFKIERKQVLNILPLVLFFCSFLVSWLFGPASIAKGFFGSQGRLNGLAIYGSLAIISVAIILLFVDEIKSVFENIFFFTILLEAIYCSLQILQKDPVNWDFTSIGKESVLGTLGNPNFVSSFMSIGSIFLIIASFSYPLWSLKSLFYKIVSFFSIVIVLRTESLQGILLLFIGSFLLLFIYALINYEKVKQGFYPIIFALLTLSFSAVLALSGKIPKFDKLSVDTFIFRIEYMKVGLKMFADNPWFGVGVDSFAEHFRQYRSLENFKVVPNILVDNPHNIVIALASCCGIFVAISYIYFLCYVGIKIFSYFKHAYQTDVVLMALCVSWILFVIQSFISIDNAGLAPWFWILGALILGDLRLKSLSENKGYTKSSRISHLQKNQRSDLLIVFRWSLSALALVCMAISWNTIVGKNRDLKSLRVYASSNPGVPNSSIDENFVRKLYDHYYYDSAYARILAVDAFSIGLNNLGEEISKSTMVRFPRVVEVINLRAKILEVTQRSEEATQLRKISLDLDPLTQDLYIDYAFNLLLTGKKERAAEVLEKGLVASYENKRIKDLLSKIYEAPVLGAEVQHNLYGVGKVISITGSSIAVEFYNKDIGVVDFDRDKAPLVFIR